MPDRRIVIDLYAGPGGWDVAASDLGLRPVGWELDASACATRGAAGHLTVRQDVATDLGRIIRWVVACADGWVEDPTEGAWNDERSKHILQPLRWAWHRPRPRRAADGGHMTRSHPPRIPGDDVRAHLTALLASGWTIAAIARTAGVAEVTLRAIRDGQATVTAGTAAAITGVRNLTTAGLQAHLRALLASGLTIDDIATEARVTRATVRLHLNRRGAQSWIGTGERLAAVQPLPAARDLDPAPLLAAVAGRPLSATDRTALLRARRSGRISERIADRIAIAAGVGPLPLIYPWEAVA